MKVKCKAKDCFYNKNNICLKEEIEIEKVSAYDNSAECIDYYVEKSNPVKCWCCNNINVTKGTKCKNCGEIV